MESHNTTSPSADTVLIVEDSKAIGSLLKVNIKQLAGIEAKLVTTLKDAKALLDEEAGCFYVAVLDLNLPDAPNGEIVDLVQSYNIPVIVLTGSLDPSMRDQMFNKQVADYVVKHHFSGIEYVIKLVDRLYANRDRKILVVDDSASFRLYLEALLQNHGYRTITASNGLEGLQTLKAHSDISLVVTDYNMPEMDGMAMTEEIRMIRSRDDLAIIALSDARVEGLSTRLLKNGASDFLAKPFQIEEFYCRVDQNLDMIRYICQARDAANRDFLTRCYNRRYFFDYVEKVYQQAQQGELQIAVAMVDADHFKQVNDVHGHQIGDDALIAIANAMEHTLDSSGLLARFGGEEFVILLILSPGQIPRDILEKVRLAIEQIDLRNGAAQVPLTASIGCTSDLCGDIEQMLAKADEAVYQAKEAGRNRVVCI